MWKQAWDEFVLSFSGLKYISCLRIILTCPRSSFKYIFISFQVAIILIIFAKRQITRFALKSSPHVAITAGVPKVSY